MRDFRNCSLVLLLLFCAKNVFPSVIRYPQPFSHSKEISADQITDATNELVYPVLYPLARLAIDSQEEESKIEESQTVNEDEPATTHEEVEPAIDETENVEQVHSQKTLKRPLAFSYNTGADDLKSAATHGGGHKHGHGGGKHESGGGKHHHSEHHSKSGEKESKGYKGHHVHEKSSKGHHDKEGHKGSYSDEGGKKKSQFEEHDYEGEHHKGDKGEKGSKFDEEGKHEKGHSTKGGHSVNKKDHYEKKHEFFDEYYEGGDHEKHGGFHSEKDYHKGGSKKGGHHKSGHHDNQYGKKGHSEKGKHYAEHKGHKDQAGHEEHHSHDTKHGEKEDKSAGKKWGYKKGDGGGGGGGGGHGHGGHGQESKHTYKVQEKEEDNAGNAANAGNSGKQPDNDSSALEALESIVKSMEIVNTRQNPKPQIFPEGLEKYTKFKVSTNDKQNLPQPFKSNQEIADLKTIGLIIKSPLATKRQSTIPKFIFNDSNDKSKVSKYTTPSGNTQNNKNEHQRYTELRKGDKGDNKNFQEIEESVGATHHIRNIKNYCSLEMAKRGLCGNSNKEETTERLPEPQPIRLYIVEGGKDTPDKKGGGSSSTIYIANGYDSNIKDENKNETTNRKVKKDVSQQVEDDETESGCG